MSVKIFCCYAHEDEPLLNTLKAHLTPLQRQGLIELWYDQDIHAGTEWAKEIDHQIDTAHIILLLISPDFLASDYCYGIEMKRALERHESGKARVIPIILRPVHWEGVLGKLQALPKNAIPVIHRSWYSPDQAFYDIAEGIRKAVEQSLSSSKQQHVSAKPLQERLSELLEQGFQVRLLHKASSMHYKRQERLLFQKRSGVGGKVVAIDLGMRNVRVAVIQNDKPIIVPNAEGARFTPSVVAINRIGEILIGEVAMRQALTNPENTITSLKHFIGRKYNDPELDHYRRLVPYKIVRASNGDAWVEVQGEQYSPSALFALILERLKTDTEAYLAQRVTQAIMSVPASFNTAQCQAIKNAGTIAGLEILGLIDEPFAALRAYGLDKKKDVRIAVCDLSGRTFDISILEPNERGFHVKSTKSDPCLGGDDFDWPIIDWLADQFCKEQHIDLRRDRIALHRLKEAAEKAKKDLSCSMQTEINLPFITADASGPKHITKTLSRLKYEQLTENLVIKLHRCVITALLDAGTRPEDLHEVVLVGSSTRLPVVQSMVRRIFNLKPYQSRRPNEVVVMGTSMLTNC